MHLSSTNMVEKNTHYKLKSSDDGLTNVITIVLVIAIIMTLLVGPYLTVIVPEQSRRNESEHVDDIKESFGLLRGAINNQLLEESSVQNTRIKLGTDNENLFVQGGDGVLYFESSEPLVTISSFYDSDSIYARGSGNIRYRTRNLYYSDISMIYENNGVVTSQGDQSTMRINPDIQLVRRDVFNNLGLDVRFARLTAGYTNFRDIYLSNTATSSVTFNRGRVTWIGGNASTLTTLNIAGNPIEYSGLSASGTTFNFDTNYELTSGSVRMYLIFDSDVRDAYIEIELFTTTDRSISTSWPIITSDTVGHAYDLTFPTSQTVEDIKFKNICDRTVTIDNIALSWTGDADLKKLELPSHGGVVWDAGASSRSSPAIIQIQNDSIFAPNEVGDVNLYFDGIIRNKNLSIKFFAENSSNNAQVRYPISFNETYINASFTVVTLITDDINIGGKGSVIVKTTLISAENNRYLWTGGESIRFNITTSYPNAWLEYMNNTLVNSADLIWDNDGIGAFEGDYYITTEQKTEELTNINFILNSINKMDCLIGIVQVELG
jgi:hypothetical protein